MDNRKEYNSMGYETMNADIKIKVFDVLHKGGLIELINKDETHNEYQSTALGLHGFMSLKNSMFEFIPDDIESFMDDYSESVKHSWYTIYTHLKLIDANISMDYGHESAYDNLECEKFEWGNGISRAEAKARHCVWLYKFEQLNNNKEKTA